VGAPLGANGQTLIVAHNRPVAATGASTTISSFAVVGLVRRALLNNDTTMYT
jgi:hypothetical protein